MMPVADLRITCIRHVFATSFPLPARPRLAVPRSAIHLSLHAYRQHSNATGNDGAARHAAALDRSKNEGVHAMNLNKQPTIEELAQLFATRKDSLDNHILWVCESGEVRIDCLPADQDECAFVSQRPTMRTRLRTYRRGQGYVGRRAAADRHFLRNVLSTLEHEWQGQQARQDRLLDRYC